MIYKKDYNFGIYGISSSPLNKIKGDAICNGIAFINCRVRCMGRKKGQLGRCALRGEGFIAK